MTTSPIQTSSSTTTTWNHLLPDLHLLILSQLPLSDAISITLAYPVSYATQHVRHRIRSIRHLRDLWLEAQQTALRSYANPKHYATREQREVASASDFSRLTCLPIPGRGVESLSGIHELSNLQVLDVSFNKLTHIPPELALCKQLRLLNLGRNRLQSFPNVVMNLTQLRTLLLSHNTIRTLPSDWSKLPNLYRLGLFDCEIEGELPEQLCRVLGTKTKQMRSRTANLSRNRFSPQFIAALFVRFPALSTSVLL